MRVCLPNISKGQHSLLLASRGVRPPFGVVRTRGRGRSAAGSRAAGNKGLYLPGTGGYAFNGFRGYYPAVRSGWYGDGVCSKGGGRQEVSSPNVSAIQMPILNQIVLEQRDFGSMVLMNPAISNIKVKILLSCAKKTH